MECFTQIVIANSYSTFRMPGIFHVPNNRFTDQS